jgi:integrase
MGALALRFAILTAARTGEAIGAGWSEIDEQTAVWTVPEGRMKAQREHRVPLSREAMRTDRVAVGALVPFAEVADLGRRGADRVLVAAQGGLHQSA